MANNRWRGRAHPRVGVSLFQPEPATHEGVINRRGYSPERGFLFIFDIKERQTYFCHVVDCAEAVFHALAPGVRVAFEPFERRDGRTAARRVRLLD